MDVAASSTSMCRLRGVGRDENVNNSKACCSLASLEADVSQGLVLGINTCGKEMPGQLERLNCDTWSHCPVVGQKDRAFICHWICAAGEGYSLEQSGSRQLS